jgi:Ca2+-binding EF-hand superfamily protein
MPGEELERVLTAMDADADGFISWVEFVRLVPDLMQQGSEELAAQLALQAATVTGGAAGGGSGGSGGSGEGGEGGEEQGAAGGEEGGRVAAADAVPGHVWEELPLPAHGVHDIEGNLITWQTAFELAAAAKKAEALAAQAALATGKPPPKGAAPSALASAKPPAKSGGSSRPGTGAAERPPSASATAGQGKQQPTYWRNRNSGENRCLRPDMEIAQEAKALGMQGYLMRQMAKFDCGRKGTLSPLETLRFFESIGMGETAAERFELYAQLDVDGNGSVSVGEFRAAAPLLIRELMVDRPARDAARRRSRATASANEAVGEDRPQTAKEQRAVAAKRAAKQRAAEAAEAAAEASKARKLAVRRASQQDMAMEMAMAAAVADGEAKAAEKEALMTEQAHRREEEALAAEAVAMQAPPLPEAPLKDLLGALLRRAARQRARPGDSATADTVTENTCFAVLTGFRPLGLGAKVGVGV